MGLVDTDWCYNFRMNIHEQTRLENSDILPISVDELSERVQSLKDMEYRLCEKAAKGMGVDFKISKLRLDFVEELLAEKERFSKVFRTSKGSVYFNLQTGETIRAKMVDDQYEFDTGDGNHFMLQPMLNNLYFLSEDDAVRLMMAGELHPGEKIKTVPYDLAVVPFEMNIQGFGDRVVFKEENGELLLVGTKWTGEKTIDTSGNLVGGTHLGHPIIEILK